MRSNDAKKNDILVMIQISSESKQATKCQCREVKLRQIKKKTHKVKVLSVKMCKIQPIRMKSNLFCIHFHTTKKKPPLNRYLN